MQYKKNEVPKELEKYVVPIEGDEENVSVVLIPKSINEEMKANLQAATTENEELKGKSALLETLIGEGDVDSFTKELEELRDIRSKVEDGKLEASDKIQTEVDRRVEKFKSSYEEAQTKIKASLVEAQSKVQELTGELKTAQVKQAYQSAVSSLPEELQIRQNAADIVMNQITSKFKVEDDGTIVGRSPDGKTLLNETGEPMDIATYITDNIAQKQPFLFENFSGNNSRDSFTDNYTGEAVDLDSISGAELLNTVR